MLRVTVNSSIEQNILKWFLEMFGCMCALSLHNFYETKQTVTNEPESAI